MKRILLACALAAVTAVASAVPYGSLIRVSASLVAVGDGLNITYVLNEDADSVLIEILDHPSNSILASFNDPSTTAGIRTIAWDGTNNNSGGTDVTAGDRKVRVTASKNVAAAWTQVQSHRSVGNFGPAADKNHVFNGFSGKDIVIPSDPSLDAFGGILPTSSLVPGTVTNRHSGVIVFQTDLAVFGGGDGYATRLLRTDLDVSGTGNNQDLWGASIDPTNSNKVFFAGQSASRSFRVGDPLLNLNSDWKDPSNLIASLPRDVKVRDEGGSKFAYFIAGTNSMVKAELNSSDEVTTVIGNLFSLETASRYGKQVQFDANGNVYFVSRHIATENNSRIFRWSPAKLASAIVGDGLTEATGAKAADWIISPDTTPGNIHQSLQGIDFSPTGDVYAMYVRGDGAGIYNIGNIATGTLTATPTSGQKIIDFVAFSWLPSTFGSGLRTDFAGNIYVTDTTTEQMRLWSPGGNTTTPVVGPDSQIFTIGVSSVREWEKL